MTAGVQDVFEVLFGESIDVDVEVIHPRYGQGFNEFDIMILKLAEPSELPYIQLNLEDNVPNVNDELWVMGFGDTEPLQFIQNFAFVLMVVDLDYVPPEECDLAYGYNLIQDHMMCTSSSENKAPWYVLHLGCKVNDYGYIKDLNQLYSFFGMFPNQ